MKAHRPPARKQYGSFPRAHLLAGGSLGLVVALFLIAGSTDLLQSAKSQGRSGVSPRQSVGSDLSPLGEFPAETDAERELESMLRRPDEEIDLALANYLIVADLPQYKDFSREEYFRLLELGTESVQDLIRRAEDDPGLAGPLSSPANLAFVFASGVIGLGIDYREEFQNMHLPPEAVRRMYRDPNNLFLAGLLRTGRGTCTSMPMLYLLLAEKLGYPLHLVSIGQHSFVRWEQPGYRMNFETTIVRSVSMTPSDEVFLETEGLTRDQIAGTDALLNLTKRAVVGGLFHVRACHFYALGPRHLNTIIRDSARATHLAPDNSRVREFHRLMLARRVELESRDRRIGVFADPTPVRVARSVGRPVPAPPDPLQEMRTPLSESFADPISGGDTP